MKKLFVGIVAAFMMAASLVAVSGGSATASPARCGYGACIPTDTQIRAFSPKPRKIRAIAGVSAGNIRVNRGRIKIQVKGNGKYRQKIGNAPKVKVTFRSASRCLPGAGQVHPRPEPLPAQRRVDHRHGQGPPPLSTSSSEGPMRIASGPRLRRRQLTRSSGVVC